MAFESLYQHLRRLIRQYGRFVVVGGLATLTHIGLMALLMETVLLSAMTANILAFLTAVLVSYVGHFKWTFREHTEHIDIYEAHGELFRFFVTALLGLGLNSTFVWVVTGPMQLSYLYVLAPMAFLTPILVFLIGHYWVFPANN